MRHLLFIIFTLVSFFARSQGKQENHLDGQKLPERIQYINNPNPNDSLCISEIERAKNDVKNGKIVFTQRAGFLFGNIRYETELRELCNQNGLEFQFDLIGCIVFKGETDGCYGDYMDKVIIDHHGMDFKKNLHMSADSLFLSRIQLQNKAVRFWECDEYPSLPYETESPEDFIIKVTIESPDIKEKEGLLGGWPLFEIGFIVEKDSTISGFYSYNFVAKLEENEAFKMNFLKLQ